MSDRKVLLTDEKIQKVVDEYNKHEIAYYGEAAAITNTVEDYTCNSCIDKYKCESSFDPYNTGGDCLENK